MIVGVGDLRPVDLEETSPGLNETTGQQAALAERVATIPFAQCRRLLGEIEGIAGAAGNHQAQGLAVILVEIILLDRLLQSRHAAVDLVPQFGPPLQPVCGNFVAEAEVVDLDPVHLRHIHVVAGWIEIVRIIGPTEKPGGACLAHDVALLQGPRHHDKRQHRHLRRLQANNVAADIREILGTGRFQLAGRTYLVRRIAGQHLVNSRRVVEQSHRRVAHRSDQGSFVEDLRELRQELRYLHARELGIDRLENAADLVGNIILWIPEIKVTGTSLKIEQDKALGLAEPRSATDALVGGGLLQAKDVGQAEAERCRAADAQHIAAGYPITSVFSGPSWNHKHGRHLEKSGYGRRAFKAGNRGRD